MSDEGFLRRWARRKSELRSEPSTEVRDERDPAPQPAPQVAEPVVAAAAIRPAQLDDAAARPLPTMADVAALDKDADFSAFVARGVDQAVRRGALKKLFADPHFNVMDRLDVYIDDYTKPSPVSEAMLASLEHAKSVFMKMVEDEPEPAPQAEKQPEPQAAPQQPPEQETQ